MILPHKKYDLIIIGAGLTGLALAYQLRESQKKILIVEARDRLGGRIETLRKKDKTHLELGATWFGKKHESLRSLMYDLGLESMEQEFGDQVIYEAISTSPPQLVELPANNQPSYRIKGGSDLLIHALAKRLSDRTEIRLETVAVEVIDDGEQLQLRTQDDLLDTKKLVSTLPPLLLHNSLKLPPLPEELLSVLSSTHTWMGESIKIGMYVEEPFWRSEITSATLFSNVGPINEMYQHSNFSSDQHALMGFLNGSYHGVSRGQRRAVVTKQLARYYGKSILDLMQYEEKVWRREAFTFTASEENLIPHQNNGHAIYRKAFLDGKFMIAGAETAALYAGYMDGAVRSSIHVAGMI